MNVVEFAEYLVKSIVTEPDLVKVSMFEADEDTSILEIIVPESEMGRVIGKNGKLVGFAYGTDLKEELLELER